MWAESEPGVGSALFFSLYQSLIRPVADTVQRIWAFNGVEPSPRPPSDREGMTVQLTTCMCLVGRRAARSSPQKYIYLRYRYQAAWYVRAFSWRLLPLPFVR